MRAARAMAMLMVVACAPSGGDGAQDGTDVPGEERMTPADSIVAAADSAVLPSDAGEGGESGGEAGGEPPSQTGQKVERTGIVVASGLTGQPITQLRVSGEPPVRLTGSLESELRGLQGARVTVTGTRSAAPPGGGIDVVRYVILEIDGARPWVGDLQDDRETLVAENGERYRLVGLPEPLAIAGARLWVTGGAADGRIQVLSAGRIR